jgi:hypothetical protein
MGEHLDKLIELSRPHMVKGYKTKSGRKAADHIRGGEGPAHRALVQKYLALQAEMTGQTPDAPMQGSAEV